jgi:glucose-6-phosphate 1-epimerase
MIEHKKFSNGFEYIEISNASACARVALQGAHLFHYERVGHEPLLWLSSKSFFEQGRAIRGGVPICWPWFGKHPTTPDLPQHGFARISMWEPVESRDNDPDVTKLTLQLNSSAKSREQWPYAFELQLHISVGPELTIRLTTKNCDRQPFTITAALHSYFAVSAITNVSVEGLDNIPYFDALTAENKIQKGRVTVQEEVDRVYQQVCYPLTIHDQNRTIQVNAHGSSSAVVWNPWIDKCAAMGDMPDNGYTTMLCIETANALQDIREIAPGAEPSLTAILSC